MTCQPLDAQPLDAQPLDAPPSPSPRSASCLRFVRALTKRRGSEKGRRNSAMFVHPTPADPGSGRAALPCVGTGVYRWVPAGTCFTRAVLLTRTRRFAVKP